MDDLTLLLNAVIAIATGAASALMGVYLVRTKRREYDAGTIASQDRRITTLEADCRVERAARDECERSRAAVAGDLRRTHEEMMVGFAERDARIGALSLRVKGIELDNGLMKRSMRTLSYRLRDYDRYVARLGIEPMEFEHDADLHDMLNEATKDGLREHVAAIRVGTIETEKLEVRQDGGEARLEEGS